MQPQRVNQEPAWTGWTVGGDANLSFEALTNPSTRIGPCFVQTGVVRTAPQVGEGATYINEQRMDDSGSFHLRCELQGMVETARTSQTNNLNGGDEPPDPDTMEEMTPQRSPRRASRPCTAFMARRLLRGYRSCRPGLQQVRPISATTR